MKNIIMLFFIILLTGCDYIYDEIPYYELDKEFLSDFQDAIDKKKKFDDVMTKWVPYQKDKIDCMKNPTRTLTDGYGDCEDKSLLFLYAYYRCTGDIGVIITGWKNITDGHTWCNVNRKSYFYNKKYKFNQRITSLRTALLLSK